MLKGYPSSVATSSFMQEEIVQQMKSEQEIFGCYKSNRGPKELLIHIPQCSKNKRQPDLKAVKNNVDSQEPFLQTTSKTPLNFQGLDEDKLFVSTLNENARHYSHTMERHSSYQEKGSQYYQYSTTRRCSLSEEMVVPTDDLLLVYDNRRTSVQSDAALSTELIRRFSSGSTTSTVATSISSSSMMTNDNKLYGNNNNNYAQTTTTTSISSSMNGVASSSCIKDSSQAMETTEKENKLISQQENNIPNEPQQQQKLGRDPGHSCNTTQSPSFTTTAKHSAETSDDKPIWADSVKIKENPMRYEFIQNYLRSKDISFQSSLPLSKPCMFYFSDTNCSSDYASTVKSVFQCDTVWQFSNFWRIFYKQLCYCPSQLTFNQNIYCFNKGVEPMWEDEANKHGGRLILSKIQQAVFDDLFEWIILAFIGGNLFDYGVVGIAFSKRYRGDRIELWLNESDNTILLLQEKLCSILPSSCHNEINASRYKKHF